MGEEGVKGGSMIFIWPKGEKKKIHANTHEQNNYKYVYKVQVHGQLDHNVLVRPRLGIVIGPSVTMQDTCSYIIQIMIVKIMIVKNKYGARLQSGL